MEPIQDNYPIFEANQVLSNSHLNQVFNYLDEQERLTRANLIGIGIVCGLEIRLETMASVATIHLSKGCGITSEGYLIVEPIDLALVSYREYKLPSDLDYPPFKDKSAVNTPQYSLWEMFPAGEPNTTLLGTPEDFLSDKAVLLFLELKKEGLRNCSPNNCDDKGSEVTGTVRRLLVKVDDLSKIIAEANKLGTGLTFTDLETTLLAQLNLPDLRLPRYNVPNTSTATSHEVLAAFLAILQTEKLALHTGNALTAAYDTFKPLVEESYPSNPFASFSAKFGFLDDAPTTTTQVRFLQYYCDFFDDLLHAYDEFRWKGVELMCACCPPEGLFPRHLMLGVLVPTSVSHPNIYRHQFFPSAAIDGCEERTKELRQLFQRIVAMIAQFTDEPRLSTLLPNPTLIDTQIHITPSILGDKPLSEKAIPYYYQQPDDPPLFKLWNAERTRRGRDNQNLSYRSAEYQPTAPAFVTNALQYDLEPYNFLRIEGHLGKPYQRVLTTLLSMKSQFRLPIEIIALRTGVFDEKISIDLSKEECSFQDLETLYDALREELICNLCEGVRYLYDISLADSDLAGGTPQLLLLKTCAPNYRYKKGTVGAWYEKYLERIQSMSYIDVDQNKIDNEVFRVYCSLFAGTVPPEPKYYAHIVSIYYFTKLAEILPSSLNALGYADFENKYQDLMSLIRFFRDEAESAISEDFKQFIPQEDLIDHFDQVLFACKLEPVRAIHEEYERRIREVKQKQFLSFFLQKNPGIQHKAGVPLGGTFIIAYHDDPVSLKGDFDIDKVRASLDPNTTFFSKADIDKVAISKAFKRISAKPQFVLDPDVSFLLGAFTGQIPDLSKARPPGTAVDKIIEETVNGLDDGTVIADFFLPYLCCSDCAPVQYTLPVPPLGLTVQLGCTDPTGSAEATLIPQGGMAPFTYQLDTQPFQPLTGKLVLAVGSHTLMIRDSAGAESASQSLTVPGPLTIGAETFVDDVETQTYRVSFIISGGTTPYEVDGILLDNTFTSAPVNSGETVRVTITDSVGCTASKDFQHTVAVPCDLPCEGQSRRCAYRLWVQPPFDGATYETYSQDRRSNIRFRFNGEDINLPGTTDLLNADAAQLNEDFRGTMSNLIEKLNVVINQALDERLGQLSQPRLVITYEPSERDPFAILWIEYFVCEAFSIEFNFSYAKPTPSFSLTMRYTNEPLVTGEPFNGAILLNRRLDNKETRAPAFDCSERNQCTGSDYRKLCEGPDPEPKFTIESLGDNRFVFNGEGGNVPARDIVAWVWDVFIAQPTEPFYEGEKVEAQVQNLGGPVRLTVITQKGCFGVAQRNLGQ